MEIHEHTSRELLGFLKSKFETLKGLTNGLPDSQSKTARYLENQCIDGAKIVTELATRLDDPNDDLDHEDVTDDEEVP